MLGLKILFLLVMDKYGEGGNGTRGTRGAGGPGGRKDLPSKLSSTRVAILSKTNEIFVAIYAS